MKPMKITAIALAALGLMTTGCQSSGPRVLATGGAMPLVWIDSATGHRTVRLSRRDGNNRTFYFHNNPFLATPDSGAQQMLFYGSTADGYQLFSVNLDDDSVRQLTRHAGRISGEIVSPVLREAFYQSGDSVFCVHVDDGREELLYVFPQDFQGHIASVNCTGTLLAGVWGAPQKRPIRLYPHSSSFDSSYSSGSPFERIFEAHIPHVLFTLDLRTKQLHKIDSEDNWLNHEQFSPTDPDMLLYAHEGPWDRVDRTWVINVSTGVKRLLHKRSVPEEINGHEWWAPDGKSVWYDLQIPMGERFYVAGVDLATGVEKRYAITRDEWSVHFTLSPDEKLFAGDGGDSLQVARAKDGKWMYLLRPRGDSLQAERLVDMRGHDYQKVGGIEPNLHFTPDGKWIVFTGNFEGKDEIYAVRVSKD